jgi:hypothetical protein
VQTSTTAKQGKWIAIFIWFCFYLFHLTHITCRGYLRRGRKYHKTTKTNSSKEAPSWSLSRPAGQQSWRSCLHVTALEESCDNTIISRLDNPMGYILLKELKGRQVDKRFLAFYETRKFINIFTRGRHLPLPWARSIQFMPLHSTS